jgi:hypothetical protein
VKLDTREMDLISLQPLFDALAEVGNSRTSDPETRKFLVHKLALTAKNMKKTAKYIEDRLKEIK